MRIYHWCFYWESMPKRVWSEIEPLNLGIDGGVLISYIGVISFSFPFEIPFFFNQLDLSSGLSKGNTPLYLSSSYICLLLIAYVFALIDLFIMPVTKSYFKAKIIESTAPLVLLKNLNYYTNHLYDIYVDSSTSYPICKK